MSFGDIATSIIDTIVSVGSGSGSLIGCGSEGAVCTGSSFHPIAAAFATQGLFVQADMIYYLMYSDLGHWTPLLYMLSAMGGLIGAAMGMPPKNYIWFLLGPGIYYWLIATPMYVHGTEWRMANIPQNQAEVWKIAEVGLRNLGIVQREGITVYSNRAPSDAVAVSWLFSFYDALVSDLVQQITSWTGVYNFSDNTGAGGATNIRAFGSGGSGGISIFGLVNSLTGGALNGLGGLFGGGNGGGGGNVTGSLGNNMSGNGLSMLASMKWELLQDITSARIQNPNLRDSVNEFFSNECGVDLSRVIRSEALTAALTSGGQNLPKSIFIGIGGSGGNDGKTYGLVAQSLQRRTVPIPDTLRRFVLAPRSIDGTTDNTAFLNFFDNSTNADATMAPNATAPSSLSGRIAYELRYNNEISCDKFFSLIMNGIRWESGQVYNQLFTRAGKGTSPDALAYVLTYGWDLKTCGTSKPVGTNSACDNPSKALEGIQTARFLQDTILLYMLRNEMMFENAKLHERRSYINRTTSSQTTKDSAMKQISTTGQITKYGELFAWTQMVPYIQGILLYVLAMAYPFACVLVVVPGRHKILFQWMAFWAWVKLWDAGFAVVQVLERSVWAAMGNSSNSRNVMTHILDLQQWAAIGVVCEAGGGAAGAGCAVPRICEAGASNGCSTDQASLLALLKIFDKAMLVQGNLDLDLANGFYIFVMAALYLAVPTITGQLVLGAKAGSAGLVNSMIGGASGEAGRNSGNAYSGEINQVARNTAASTAQAAYMRSMRNAKGGKDGTTRLAALAMDSGNKVAQNEMLSSGFGAIGNMSDYQETMTGRVKESALLALHKGENFFRGATGLYDSYGQARGAQIAKNDENVKALNKQVARGNQQALGNQQGNGNGAGDGGDDGGGGSTDPVGFYDTPEGKGFGRGVRDTAISAAHGYPEYAIQQGATAQSMAMLRNRADAALNSFAHSGYARGWQSAGQRIGAEAGFAAESGAWGIKNEYAAAMAPSLAAIGVSPGVMDPGGKPTSFEGAAMAGQLGNEIYDMAHYSDGPNSAYFSEYNQITSKLSNEYGPDEMVQWATVHGYGSAHGAGYFGASNSFVENYKALPIINSSSIDDTKMAGGGLGKVPAPVERTSVGGIFDKKE